MIYGVVFFTSAAVLGYEIVFTRVYSYAQWHNLSSVIITMALIGSGAAGTAVTLLKNFIDRNYRTSLIVITLCFPLFMAAGFILAVMIPVNPYGIGFDIKQLFYMFIYFALICLPFLAGSAVICISFLREPPSLAYAVNLFGSAAGGCIPLVLSYHIHPYSIMSVLIIISLIPAIILSCGKKTVKFRLLIASVALAVILSAIISSGSGFRRVSQYKPISGALNLPDARLIAELYSPLSVLQLVEAEGLRSTSGLSIVSPHEVPLQKVIYFDGDSPSPVSPFSGGHDETAYLRYEASWLPYMLKEKSAEGRVLIIGPGGGEPILRALSSGFRAIDAVEVNSSVIKLMSETMAGFSGNIYLDKKVSIHNEDGRSFATRSPDRYDLIEIPVLDAFNSAASGVFSLNETYLYTVESFRGFYRILSDGGILSVTRWITTPPRDSLKMLNTAAEALRKTGVDNPGSRIIAVRSIQTLTLLVSERSFSPVDIEITKKFCDRMLFDLIYYPGMKPVEADKNIRQNDRLLYNSFISLLSEKREDFISSYELDISSPEDNRPYFYNYFRPAFLKYIIRYGPSQVPVTEWGYLLLLLILVPVTVVSFISILFPMIILRRKEKINFKWIAPYFSLIAAGYFFIEIPMIQKMILFLGSPAYSLGVTISSMLIFSGIGSLFSDRLFLGRKGFLKAVFFICGIVFLYSYSLDRLFLLFICLPQYAKVAIVIALAAPHSFFMGIPFPRGLSYLKENEVTSLPLAWGINGFFSVISIIAAAICAVICGYRIVLITAVICYATAGIIFPGKSDK